jgi:hypothetical protein
MRMKGRIVSISTTIGSWFFGQSLEGMEMDWKPSFKVLLRNVINTTGAAVVLLALYGFLLVGKEGLMNGAGWGLILGLISVPFSGFAIWSKYWGGLRRPGQHMVDQTGD